MRRIFILQLSMMIAVAVQAQPRALTFSKVLQQQGKDPLLFVKEKLDAHALLVFDDALHSALEPFVFYNQLLTDSSLASKLDYIFIEVFPINVQPYLDSFFRAPEKDTALLMKVFQDDYSGYGWRYQTYLDLLTTIWDTRKRSGNQDKLQVIALSPPVYWEALHTHSDYELFQQSLAARDYFMYVTMLQHMQQFKQDKKGIFLTNTRHAYKNIRNAAGQLYWNTMTFFHQWHPGRACSIRFHNVFLSRKRKKESNGKKTTEGLSDYEYAWELPANGLWDSAYNKTAMRPLAIPLAGNVFGQSPYLGNHAPDVPANTTMADAYDAVIFLTPLHASQLSARMNFFYTPAFKKELMRRIRLLEGDDLTQTLKQSGAGTLEAYVERLSAWQSVQPNTLAPRKQP